MRVDRVGPRLDRAPVVPVRRTGRPPGPTDDRSDDEPPRDGEHDDGLEQQHGRGSGEGLGARLDLRA